MALSKPILYSNYLSTPTWRVRFALALKKIDYEYRAIDLFDKSEQLKPEYKKLNPKMEVPLLIIDGQILSQSLPIIEYLNETRPNNVNLIPKDPIKRTKARCIAEVINSGIQPYQNLPVLKLVGKETLHGFASEINLRGFNAIEEILKTTSGKYCIGDEISIADLCLGPHVFSAMNRFKLNLNEFKIITRVTNEISKLQEYQISHPSKMPDYSKEPPAVFR